MISLLYSVFLSVWRRWFGGGLQKLPDNRFLQHVIGFVFAVVALLLVGISWWQSIIAAALLQGLYWARSHGCCFDFGHGTVDVSRYEQLWYWNYLKKYIPEKMMYSYACDFVLMCVRYTLPSLLIGVVLFSIPALFMGICLTGMYALCWVCYDLGLTKRPTDIAEFLGGFITGLLLTM